MSEKYLFDFDGTLVDSMPTYVGVMLRILDENKDDQLEPLDVGEIAHRQIGTHLSIPAKYYAKMLAEKPELLCANINSWMEDAPSKRMLRVLDGKARAFLSNRYLRLDHYEIVTAILPILGAK